MMDRYGRAVVEERTHPRNLAELRRYLTLEYGLGTEPDAFQRGATRGTRRHPQRVRRAFRNVIRVMSRVLGAATHGRRSGSESADHTR